MKLYAVYRMVSFPMTFSNPCLARYMSSIQKKVHFRDKFTLQRIFGNNTQTIEWWQFL